MFTSEKNPIKTQRFCKFNFSNGELKRNSKYICRCAWLIFFQRRMQSNCGCNSSIQSGKKPAMIMKLDYLVFFNVCS